MGLLTSLHGDRIYFDVNAWIYALEGYPDFIVDLTALFQAIEQGRLTAVTSEFSLAEALVKPMKDRNLAAQTIYQQAISNRDHVEVLPADRYPGIVFEQNEKPRILGSKILELL